MPNIYLEAGALTKEKKIELIKGLTKQASETMSMPESAFNVIIKEFPVENWGIGGEPLEEILQRMHKQ
jgi:4-oxalocrotonate tautomerase family enzyme